MNGISNLYFPICGLLIVILLDICFFSKESLRSKETSIFARILIYSTIDSIVMCLIMGLSIFIGTHYVMKIFNKIDFIMYILWASNFFLYVYYISTKGNKKINESLYNLMFWATTIFDIIIGLLSLILPVYLYMDDQVKYSYGPSLNIVYIGCFIYIILIALCLIFNSKKILTKKLAPLYALIPIAIFVLLLNKVDKSVVIVSAALAYVDLIMYFTIENPDVKMLEEFSKNRENTEAMNREKEVFLFNLTQDIRKPLHNIGEACGKLSLMTNDKEIKKGVDYISYNDREAMNIINNVLDINSMNASKIKIYNAKYNPKTLLENIAHMSKKDIPEKVEFRVNIDKSIPDSLYGDQIRIKQVIKILLENACEHTEEGFIELEAHEISKNDICRLVISVEDSGEGILAEKVNEIFSREDINNEIDDNAHKLSTAKSISIVLGGMLMCTSEIGKGSKFTLILDQRKDETKTKELERIEEYIDKVTAVVVSENKEYLEKVTNKLIKNNIDAVGTDLGAKAIEKIRKNPNYDYIILDEELEILNVDEILRKLREIKDFNSKVIVITKDMESERYIKTGFNGIISRKISIKDIDTLSNEQH